MKLEEIYEPISKQLEQVRQELHKIESELSKGPTKEIFENYFKNSGKLLRPALIMLSAGTLKPDNFNSVSQELVMLSTAVELIHGASLVHDDIIDGDEERRGLKTLNKAFGSKTAVLAGDVLYSKAISILSDTFSAEFSELILKVTKKMSLVEIGQLISPGASGLKEDYLELINGKTAILTGACCTLGAKINGALNEEALRLGNYGAKFGMTYQIVDDYMDDDPFGTKNVKLEEAENYAAEAKQSISGFADSPYKKSLENMLDYVLGFSHKPA